MACLLVGLSFVFLESLSFLGLGVSCAGVLGGVGGGSRMVWVV